MIKIVTTDSAPKAIGPYAQAVIADGFVYCSGQIGLEAQTGQLKEGIEEQTKQVLKNIAGVLTASGTTVASVVKTSIFLTDINDFTVVNDIYSSFFGAHTPARSTVVVAKLPKGALVEIEAVAITKKT